MSKISFRVILEFVVNLKRNVSYVLFRSFHTVRQFKATYHYIFTQLTTVDALAYLSLYTI
jgi:hypothetical protein